MNENLSPIEYFNWALETGEFIEFSYKNIVYVISPVYDSGGNFNCFSCGLYEDDERKYDKYFKDIKDLKTNCIIDGKNIMEILPDVDYICEN